MASVDILRTPKQGSILFYDLDEAVGTGAPNKRPDILLVQYLMREAPKTARFAGQPFPAPLTVDGNPGPGLIANIKHFQSVLRAKSASLSVVDGRVDPVPSDKNRSTISGTQYTIINLNLNYRTARSTDYEQMAKATDCPNELRTPLTPKFMTLPA